MLALYDYGISPSDSIMLMDYIELDFFVEELKKKKAKKRALESFNLINDLRDFNYFVKGGDKGFSAFKKWSLDKIDFINGKHDEEVQKVKPKKSMSEVFKNLSGKKKSFVDVVRGKHGV